ncbi:MAG: cell wall hydrolase [Lachnospiraceae bacterium]
MLRKTKTHLLHTATALLCTVTITFSGNLAYAAPSSKELEKKTSEIQEEIDTINSDIDSLSSELENTTAEIEKKTSEIEKSRLDVAAAKLNEENQYSAMKERIKFMYEGGNISLLQILLSSESMSDFLNKAEYVTLISDYDREMLDEFKDIRKNVEKKQEKLERQQQELSNLEASLNAQKSDLTSKLSTASGELDEYTAQLERAKEAEAAAKAAREAEEAEKAKALEVKKAEENSSDNSNTGSADISDTSTIALMAAILECEAGATYEGMIAVGTVIMNRVASSRFPNTIRDVIYQSGQFSPVNSGKLDRVLKRGPSSSAYEAAKAVLGGERHSKVKDCLFFNAAYTGKKGIIVGGNVFW